MTKISVKSILLLLFVILPAPVLPQDDVLFFDAAGTPSNPKVQVSWNKYYTYAGVTDFCKKLAEAYPNLVSMSSPGKSYQGRDIHVLTISDKKAGDPDHKPGF